MRGVTSEVIAEVRSRAQILDVISEVVVLKRSGKDYKGLCPFHNEKTPSFHVNLEKGIYKCFGCGEGGDVFTFVQKTKGVEFVDCVHDLAHRFGVTLIESSGEKQEYDRRSLTLLLYQQASGYYHRLLNESPQAAAARTYLAQRGIDEQMISQFKLGYATGSWDGLLHYLGEANKVTPASLEEAGLVRRRRDSTSYFDLFRNRLMIPILDEQGRVIAFGGRTLGDDQIKYLNSPETAIYTKGQHLFAFHLAKEAIKTLDSVIVVEGYFDAITAHQAGFKNTVATLGTALTSQQAKMLVRYTDSRRVLLSFDVDQAGFKAIDRGIETLNQVAQGVGVDLRVINLQGGKDPDECLRGDNGVELFTRAIKEALPLIDYQLAAAVQSVNLSTHIGKIEAAKRIVPILAQIRNSVSRGEYVRQSALKLGIKEEELLSDVLQFTKENRLSFSSTNQRVQQVHIANNSERLTKRHSGMTDGTTKAEQSLLALFLISSDSYEKAYQALKQEELITPTHKRIREAIYALGSHFNNLEDLEYKLRDRLAAAHEDSKALIEIILKAQEMKEQNEPIEAMLKDFRKRLMQERLELATSKLLMLLRSNGDSEQSVLQSKIRELGKLKIALPVLTEMSEIEALKGKIDELITPYEQLPAMETIA